ncbi:spore cortex-lytic enzyme [Lentibacillus sp. CBA3610]|uniref:spore cortex-lytic enzyme n=1 Tax=Lentibacillus sp. CBA3610 TaxID=2518176 RepID=UPI00159626F7|nr:spore cortex-lytic enzyme [Lentibacillus sp. CBA3610]QKY69221.1 spore cortex-lytic enzyme [Lentibacillus sp. CBA3610]
MTNKKMYLFIIICFLVLGVQTTDSAKPVSAFTDQVIQHGAVGEDVIELQARLQYLGFYNGDIDGVFGWGTYWALRNFQYEFGMEIDGLAGTATKEKLTEASEYDREYVQNQINQGNDFTHYGGADNSEQSQPSPDNNNNAGNNETNNQADNNTANNDGGGAEPTAVNVPQGYSQNDIQLMANAVNGEARGEPYEGQVAVAAVILNRVESPTFPNSVSGVIFEPRAFTAVADGQIWLTPSDTSTEAVLDAINGWDPSGNATYYFNPETATSDWIWSRPQIKRIGKHIFAK